MGHQANAFMYDFKDDFSKCLRDFDLNQDNYIDFQELVTVFTRMGQTYWAAICDAREIFNNADHTKDGRLSIEDATHLCNAQFSGRTQDLVQRLKWRLENYSAQTINQIDRNNDYQVDQNELTEYLKQDGVPAYEASAAATTLLFNYDLNHDGKLSILDFLNR